MGIKLFILEREHSCAVTQSIEFSYADATLFCFVLTCRRIIVALSSLILLIFKKYFIFKIEPTVLCSRSPN